MQIQATCTYATYATYKYSIHATGRPWLLFLSRECFLLMPYARSNCFHFWHHILMFCSSASWKNAKFCTCHLRTFYLCHINRFHSCSMYTFLHIPRTYVKLKPCTRTRACLIHDLYSYSAPATYTCSTYAMYSTCVQLMPHKCSTDTKWACCCRVLSAMGSVAAGRTAPRPLASQGAETKR